MRKMIDTLCETNKNLDDFAGSVLTSMFKLMDVDTGSVQVHHDEHTFTKIHRCFPDKIRKFFKYKEGMLLSDAALESGTILHIENFQTHAHIEGCPLLEVTSFMSIPLIYQEKILGVINLVKVDSDSPFPKINPDELSTLTNTICMSLHNVLLVEEAKKKQVLDKELNEALVIQEELLPLAIPYSNNFDFARISIAAKELSGDFYDFIDLPNNQIGVVMVDITGKGIQAGLFMAMVKSILNLFLPESNSPKEVIQKINHVLCERKIIKKYLPIFYGIINPEDKTFVYCNAGMEPALFCTDEGLVELTEGGPPVGAFLDSTYVESSITLLPNDLIVMITDGITDARNIKAQDIGLDKVCALIKDNRHLPAQDILNNLVYYAQEFIGDRAQKDDITMVAIKMDPSIKANCCIVPLDFIEMKSDGTVASIEKTIKAFQRLLIQTGLSDLKKSALSFGLTQINTAILQQSYINATKGKITYKFLVYTDKIEIVIRDYGQGITPGNIDACLSNHRAYFDDVRCVAVKIGSEICLRVGF